MHAISCALIVTNGVNGYTMHAEMGDTMSQISSNSPVGKLGSYIVSC